MSALIFGVVMAGTLTAYLLKPRYSYHVMLGMNGSDGKTTYVFWWPLGGFGQFCTSESTACDEYEKCVAKDPKSDYQLVRYAVKTRGLFSIEGITGEPFVLRSTEKS